MDGFRYMHVAVHVSDTDSDTGIVMPEQCHSSVVKVVESGTDDRKACDALVTTNMELTLGIHTRDCAPICFADGERIATAHVGWHGLCGGIIENVLRVMEKKNLEVFVGPHLHAFEIQKDFCYDAVVKKFGNTFLNETNGKLTFQFKDAIASLLPIMTTYDERDTAVSVELPSYRHKRMFGHIITTVGFTQNI